jgi:hypothetical protein
VHILSPLSRMKFSLQRPSSAASAKAGNGPCLFTTVSLSLRGTQRLMATLLVASDRSRDFGTGADSFSY